MPNIRETVKKVEIYTKKVQKHKNFIYEVSVMTWNVFNVIIKKAVCKALYKV